MMGILIAAMGPTETPTTRTEITGKGLETTRRRATGAVGLLERDIAEEPSTESLALAVVLASKLIGMTQSALIIFLYIYCRFSFARQARWPRPHLKYCLSWTNTLSIKKKLVSSKFRQKILKKNKKINPLFTEK